MIFKTDIPIPQQYSDMIRVKPIIDKLKDKYGNNIITSHMVREYLGTNTDYAMENTPNEYRNWVFYGMPFAIMNIYNWGRYKQMYLFDKDTFDLLADTDLEDVQCKTILEKIPYDSIFIENHFSGSVGGDIVNIVGTFASIIPTNDEDRTTTTDKMLNLFFLKEDGEYLYCFIPLEETDSSNIIKAVEDRNVLINKEYATNGTEYTKEYMKKSISIQEDMLNLSKNILGAIVYLCADNKEIKVVKHFVKDKRDKKERAKVNALKDITQTKVGFIMGNTIRKNKHKKVYIYENNEDNYKPKGTPKKAHMRRGHYHHFWVGSKEQRKLVLHYIPPLFIKGNLEEKVAVRHKVE